MNSGNAGIDLPKPPAHPRRPLKGSNDGKLDIQAAIDFMDEASGHVFQMSEDLAKFAGHAKALVDGPLTMECIVTLLQASMPNQRNGRPQPEALIRGVLEAAAGLGTKYLKPATAKR